MDIEQDQAVLLQEPAAHLVESLADGFEHLQLDALTAAQLQALAAQGVRTVIDLRQPEEDRGYHETAQAEALGLRYVRIPVAGAEGLDAANVRAVHQALQQSQGPVLLHCASGNRAGAVLALVNARYEHATPDQALPLGQRAGLKSLEAATRQRLAEPVTSP
ncbi:MAG TPA: hypothetical protein DCP40_01060 [Stenotrophomonas sp.]|nr:hypothetical protein [Stenotrophomonas sp.]